MPLQANANAAPRPRSRCQHCDQLFTNNVLRRHEQQCWTPATLERLYAISRADTTDPNACWEWRTLFGGVTLQYPRLQKVRVHRLVCTLQHGPAPADKPYALHSCDNLLCINWHHLRWGTQSENMQHIWDRDRRHR